MRRLIRQCSVGSLLIAVVAICAGGSAADRAGSSTARADAVSPADTSICYSAPRPPGVDALQFADATRAEGLAAPVRGWYGHAVAAGDVDGDGWTDLFFGGFADKTRHGNDVRSPDQLLRGGRDGFHVDHSVRLAPGRTGGAAFADFDGDRDLDLVLSRNYRDWDGGRAPSIVLRNDGGRFTRASVLDARRGGRSIGVLDYDGDGRLDLFLVEDRFSGASSALFHNEGDLHFADTTARAGLPTDVDGLGVAVVDLNGDGWSDLFVGDSNRLFVNEAGTYREVSAPEFAWPRFGPEDDAAGVAAGDLDRDGRIDLVVGQHYNSTIDDGRRVPVRLYLNTGSDADGTPRFRDVTVDAGLVPLSTKAPHVEIADLDHDGWLDILTTASAARGGVPVVFRNLGVHGGRLRFVSSSAADERRYWVTATTLDADHDGDLDVFLVGFDGHRPSRLLRNEGRRAHWLGVQIGRSGSAGIGASVDVYPAGDLGDRARLLGTRFLTPSTGFGAGALPVAFFGLASEPRVDVRVTFPRAVPVVLRDVGVDRLVQVNAARRDDKRADEDPCRD